MTGGDGASAAVRRRLLPAAAVAVALALAGCGGGGHAGPNAQPLPAQRGLAVTFTTRTFVDTRRPTPAQGDAAEQPSRTLVTTIARPDGPGPFPLILFSHGFGGSAEDYTDMLRALASAGYVVAAPDYPLTSKNAPGGPQRGADLAEQPADASFVIGEMLRLSRDPSGPVSGAIDPTRVGAAGHSMGAGVTMGLGYNSCCKDERVRAGVLMAANTPSVYRGDFFVPPPTPILVIHGDQDDTLDYAGGRTIFLDADPPKFFLTVFGGDHKGPYTAGPDVAAQTVVAATVDFFDAYLKGRPDGIGRLQDDADRPGVTKLDSVVK